MAPNVFVGMSLFVTLLLIPIQGYPWGSTGHRVVGEIAQRHLIANAREKILALLISDKGEAAQGYSKSHFLAQIANWADEIRSDKSMEKYQAWHMADVPDGMTYEVSPKCPEGDIVSALEKLVKEVNSSDTIAAQKIFAIKFIVHLVGDIHQPLHVSRSEDWGGNKVKVQWFGKYSNLHIVWDEDLIDQQRLSYTELADFLDSATSDEVKEWQSTSFVTWANENISFRSIIYDFSGNRTGKEVDVPNLMFPYNDRSLPIVKQRIRKAGFRLAGLLNSIFN